MNLKVFKNMLLQVFESFLVKKPKVLKLGADLIVVKRFSRIFGFRK